MARYRLLVAHELETKDGQRAYLLGDKETEPLRDEGGAVVGDGTNYRVRWPTLQMLPLDDDAKRMIKREEERLELDRAATDPVEALPIGPDDYEQRYIPGLEGRRRKPPKPDGAPAGRNVPRENIRLVASGPREPQPEPDEEEDDEDENGQPQPEPVVPPPAAATPVYNESRARVAQSVPDLEPLPAYSGPPSRPWGRPPVGYRLDDNGEKVEDPAQQASLAEIRRMSAAHYPISAMIRRLKQLKMYAPERSTIRNFLERESRGT